MVVPILEPSIKARAERFDIILALKKVIIIAVRAEEDDKTKVKIIPKKNDRW